MIIAFESHGNCESVRLISVVDLVLTKAELNSGLLLVEC